MSEPTERPDPAESFFTPRKRPQPGEGTDRPAAPGRPGAPSGPPPGAAGAPRGTGGPGRPDPTGRPQGPGAPNGPQGPGNGYRPQGPGPRTGGRPGAGERPSAPRSGFSPDETMALRVPPPPGGRGGLPPQRRGPGSAGPGRPQPGPEHTGPRPAPAAAQRTAERPVFDEPAQDGPAGGDWPAPPTAARNSVPRHDETLKLRVPDELAALAKAFDAQYARPPGSPAEEEEQEASPEAKPARSGGGRDRYLDLLRGLALVRVVLYHNFSWAWLPLVFPSMGVMFALAGSLMARSLKRPALTVIRGRLRRLLPPMWLFGVVMMTLWILDGWGPDSEGHPNWWWGKLAFWILPISTPPYPVGELHGFGLMEDSWGTQVGVPLWYLRAYLWYVLLSPLMLRALRRFPLVTVLTPLVLTFFSGLLPEDGRIWETYSDFTIFGSCWILGMAHNEGLLKKIPQYVAPSVAPLVMVAGYWWYVSRPALDPTEVGDLEGVPIAQAVWSFGFVLLLLHLSPSWEQWPRRLEPFNGIISLLNARAVSVYLWHTLALELSVPVIDQLWRVDYLADNWGSVLGSPYPQLFAAIPLIGLFVLSFGWIEDVAAKRSPRLFPYPRKSRGRRRAAG
ncbi:acyltransferase family protein [Streptomyces sp. NRRL B-24484]|uniref:acyltransferase family protein n=1 Tax=Streptomyces sp. NRRL B-24484 TaxID=1463833 RepID=UPI000AF02D82|nr:acyltransferase family protein [Streptomyces sp. NRRL B-24484]